MKRNHSQLALDRKMSYLRQFGSHAISYSTLQPGLNDFHLDGIGYASYANYWGYNFILGDPICAAENMPYMVRMIVRNLDHPLFAQVSGTVGRHLHEHHGYKVTQLGIETALPVQEYSLGNDTRKRNLRSFVRKGQEQSTVYELTKQERESRFGITDADMIALTDRWFSDKPGKKMLFLLVRKSVYEDEPFVRKFYSIDANHRLLGFSFFNPLFKDGEVIGYCADSFRAIQSASKGHVSYIIIKAWEKFKEEGKQILSLGLSPCADVGKTDMRHSTLIYHLEKLFYRYGNTLYNFKGLDYNKKQYHAVETPTFVATPSRNLIGAMMETTAFNKCVGLI